MNFQKEKFSWDLSTLLVSCWCPCFCFRSEDLSFCDSLLLTETSTKRLPSTHLYIHPQFQHNYFISSFFLPPPFLEHLVRLHHFDRFSTVSLFPLLCYCFQSRNLSGSDWYLWCCWCLIIVCEMISQRMGLAKSLQKG